MEVDIKILSTHREVYDHRVYDNPLHVAG